MKRIVLGITGASGSIYAVRLTEELVKRGVFVHVVCTANGLRVLRHETGLDAAVWAAGLREESHNVALEDADNLFSPVASGSFPLDAVVVAPCSMGTLGKIACGAGDNLVCRAADVALKEGRRLLLMPRETPLSAIHLENMLKLSRLGAGILPPEPGFYNHPQTLDDAVNFVVGKALDWLCVEHQLYKKWGI